MKHRPVKTIWVVLICVGVLGYLLVLGQVNIRQFERKLTLSSQKTLLQLAQAKQRHCSDLFELLSRQLCHIAGQLSSPWRISGQLDGTPAAVVSFWGPTILAFDQVDEQGEIIHRYRDDETAGFSSYAGLLEKFRKGSPALDEAFMTIDVSLEPACISMLYPLSEGTTFRGALVLRIPVAELLKRLNDDAWMSGTSICLVDSEGEILAFRQEGAVLPLRMNGQEVSIRSMLEDVKSQREGFGVFTGVSPEQLSRREFLAGYWPLNRLDTAWSIMAIQDDSAVKTAVAEHSHDIQLGMVSLFLAVFLIWLLYYSNERRRILYEQHTAMDKAIKEMHYLSVQGRQMQQQLEQQVALYRGILNAVPMGLYWKDRDGRLVGYNTEYAAIAGLDSLSEGLCLPEPEISAFRQEGLPLDNEVMDKDVELFFLPQTHVQQGVVRSFLVSKAAVKDEKGRVCGLLGSLLNQDLLRTAQGLSLCSSPVEPCVAPAVREASMPNSAANQETTNPIQGQDNPSKDDRQGNQSARILVVDDVEENRMLLDVILCKLGYTPIQCGGGQAAVSMCRQEKFDLILMDIQMPDMNGLDATRQIRAESLNTATPIMAMTASDLKEDEQAAFSCGCDDYLTKPIHRKLLEQKIWRNLARMRQICQAEQGHEIISFLEGDPDYHKTIETFVDNLPGRIEQMRKALDAHNLKDLAFKAHALKGLGGFAGFAVYTEKAAEIENAIRNQHVDKIQQQIDQMIQMCQRTVIKSDKEAK